MPESLLIQVIRFRGHTKIGVDFHIPSLHLRLLGVPTLTLTSTQGTAAADKPGAVVPADMKVTHHARTAVQGRGAANGVGRKARQQLQPTCRCTDVSGHDDNLASEVDSVTAGHLTAEKPEHLFCESVNSKRIIHAHTRVTTSARTALQTTLSSARKLQASQEL